ncbi:MAG: alanine dehydrogenase [Saprospiraceae bacterium]|nr:alanine dehydrogenase [Saprospiraceae bacterium]MBP7699557.1 alanine dehydrogenase [Saprospiraceae bacterium]
MNEQRRIPIPDILAQGQYETKPETLQVPRKPHALFIGIPRDTILQENRVALTPASVATLVAKGHRVIIESCAGVRAHFFDREYSEAGAEIVFSKQEVYKANMLIKVAPPTLEEIEFMHADQMIISPLHIPIINEEYINKLLQKRVISLAMEYIQDDSGSFPVVRIMSEIAGLSAMLTAAELLTNVNGGRGILLGGISGVPPTRVVILGGGVVAEYATRTALGLGAEVRIFDNNVYKLMRIQRQVGRQLYTSTINLALLEQELMSADVVIGAIHSSSGRTPMIVTEDMVTKMREGSVIIDVSIDQGGCFETSEVTNHEEPTFVKHGVTHYCVPNISSRVSRTASVAISNIMTPTLLRAENAISFEQLLYHDFGLRHGVYTYKGCLTNDYLGQRYQIKTTNLDWLLTSEL